MISHQQHVKFPHEPLTVALLPFHMLVCSAAPVQDWLQEGNQHLKNTTKSQKPLWILFFIFFLPWGSCEQSEQSADGRRATAGKWPHHPERAGWSRLLGRSGSYLCSPTACELSERRPRTHASNTTPDPEGGSECDVTNQPENCVQAIKTSSIYLDSWNHQCSFVLLWLLREGNILQIIIKISVSLCVSFLVLSLIWYLSSFCGVCQELPGFSSSCKIIKVFFAYSRSQMFLFVCMASLFSLHAE